MFTIKTDIKTNGMTKKNDFIIIVLHILTSSMPVIINNC